MPEEPIAPAAPVPAEESVDPVVSVPTEEPVDLFEAQTTLFEPAVTEELSAPPAQVSEAEPQQTTQIKENKTNREEPTMPYTPESGPENVVTLKVVGVGGAGNNVVNRMVKSGTQGIEYVAINTDKQALAVSSADQKIQIGEKLTHGQGAGSDPEMGKRSAEESRNNIAKSLENADMVFITAGMGGGTGTGAAPTIADIAREAGILTVAVVTKPFKFEGKRRMDQAMVGINELLGKVDSLLIIPNDRLKYATDQKVTLANAFEIADDVLRQAVTSISDLIKNTGFINLDFADVTCIMKDAGFAHMGVGHAAGKGKAEDAARMAVASPLMETSINGARGVLINITGSEDMGLEDVETAANLVQEAAHPDANIIFGASFDPSLDDEIRVTVIATGFEDPAKVEEPAPAAAAQPAPRPQPPASIPLRPICAPLPLRLPPLPRRPLPPQRPPLRRSLPPRLRRIRSTASSRSSTPSKRSDFILPPSPRTLTKAAVFRCARVGHSRVTARVSCTEGREPVAKLETMAKRPLLQDLFPHDRRQPDPAHSGCAGLRHGAHALSAFDLSV